MQASLFLCFEQGVNLFYLFIFIYFFRLEPVQIIRDSVKKSPRDIHFYM